MKFTALFLLIYITTVAQVKSIAVPNIRNFSRSEYKAGTQNWAIAANVNGDMYFANNDGLLQYDGTHWECYSLPNKSRLRSIQIDKDIIYVGGYGEFGYFKSNSSGKLVYHSISSKIPAQNRSLIDFVWKVHVMDGEVIFQTFDKAYIFDGKNLRTLEAPNKFQFSFVVDHVLYFQDAGLGLLRYGKTKFLPLAGTIGLNNTEVWGMFALPTGKILIATLDKGLYTYSNGKLESWNTEAGNFLRGKSCLGGVIINENLIVLNTVLDGVIVCDSNGKIIQHLNRKNGLQNNTILSSFVDQKNNLWLGLDNGITFVHENSPFTYFGFSYDLSTVYASALFGGNLYVATNQGLFFHKWSAGFKEQSFELVKGTTGQAWNIQVVSGHLLCSHNRGLMEISNNAVSKVLDSRGYWGVKPIPGSQGFYIGSNYNGFSVFEMSGSEIKYKNILDGFTKSSSAFEVENKHLWLVKDDLLYKLKLSTDYNKVRTVSTYKNLSKDHAGIGSIQRLLGEVYFQSKNHFFKYSPEQDLFIENRQLSSLFKKLPTVRLVTEDRLGNLWYVFNESMGMLKKEDNRFISVVSAFSNLTSNFLPDFFSINTIDEKNILIGLTDGLAHYDSDFQQNFSTAPSVYIQNFSIPGDTLRFHYNAQIDQEYVIPYRSNSVKFTFSSPMYENLENIQFSYYLDGYDDKWSIWSNIAVKEYTNLPEGNYRMLLKSRNTFGIESKPFPLKFQISAPWYRHWIAYIFYIMTIVVITYLIRYRIRMKIRKNKHYETILQRKLYLEKESKIREEQHELEKEIERLNNEKLQIKILGKDKELVNNSLQVVKKNKILNGILAKLKEIDTDALDENTKFHLGKLNKSVVKEVNTDRSWKDLEKHIRNVHFDYLKRLKEKYPTISPRELDLATYLLMNMSTKEIAEIMNISSGGVELARYRLRKKLELNNKENLIGFLMSI
jgi:DNA-binding CsgD family transcriptional regulator/ligand-binding sensor domain-containing protein